MTQVYIITSKYDNISIHIEQIVPAASTTKHHGHIQAHNKPHIHTYKFKFKYDYTYNNKQIKRTHTYIYIYIYRDIGISIGNIQVSTPTKIMKLLMAMCDTEGKY